MDSRRSSRTLIDPKVRQVGFVPAAAQPLLDRAQSCPPESASPPAESAFSPVGNSLYPVMIPPPRHASDNLSSALALIPPRTWVVPVPGRFDAGDEVSYHTSESLIDVTVTSPGTSPQSSRIPDLDFSENSSDWFRRSNSGKFTSNFGGGGIDIAPAKSNETRTAKLPNERIAVPVGEVQNEVSSSSKQVKERSTKAERRAMQESQRAAKAAAKAEGNKAIAASGGVAPVNEKNSKNVKQPSRKKDGPVVTASITSSDKKGGDRPPDKERKKDVPPPRLQFDDKSRVEKAQKRAVVKQTEARNRVDFFLHLPQYERGTQLPNLESRFFSQLDSMHPSVYKVGLQYLAGDIFGGNARCISMLQAFQSAIKDYSAPAEKTLLRDLTAKISSYVSFLSECRPLSISMGNAIRFLKNRILNLPLTISESEAKISLHSDIDRFINEKILLADKVIVRHAVTKIRDGDVLLTYGSSCVVEMILLYAHELGKQFRVVVVDSRPKLEGQALLRRLVRKGLTCTYTHINALSYIMHEVTRVFMGASSVSSNGTIYSRVGTACVAMVAHAFHVPVLICCEAYKFHERVQIDSICCNELGDRDDIAKVPGRTDVKYLDNWADTENLKLLNLLYDATPSDYISVIITDYGMVPTTSVPVILREYRREHLLI